MNDESALEPITPDTPTPNRAARRARGGHKVRRAAPLILQDAGGETSGAELGEKFEARTLAKMPPKRHGHHRWVAIASHILSDDDVRVSDAPGSMSMLDGSRLVHLSLGCWDCGRSKGDIEAGSFCSGPRR